MTTLPARIGAVAAALAMISCAAPEAGDKAATPSGSTADALTVRADTARADTTVSPPDTAFVALQERGKQAMGVDQYTSSHVFEDRPDGGRIVPQRDDVDAAGTATIRAHMQEIATRFAAGDFSIPGMVHAQEVPGTAVMASRRERIMYLIDTVPRGAQVRIIASDRAAIDAVHAFLAFQRMDHRAGGHEMKH